MYFISSVGCNWMNERVKASIGLQTLTGKLSLSQQSSYRFVKENEDEAQFKANSSLVIGLSLKNTFK